MHKHMTFFAPNGVGLTSTSANHIANLAKEMIRNLELKVESLTLYSTRVTLIGDNGSMVISKGVEIDELKDIVDMLHRIAEAKSLIAWLREGIKAKEEMLEKYEYYTIEKYAKEKGIILIEKPEPATPLTKDEYIAQLTPAERCRFYSIETLASTLGKAIHPGGAFAQAREMLYQREKKPNEVTGSGRDTLFYSYEPSIDKDSVEAVYFNLQKQYREAQAKVNEMLHVQKKAVADSELKSRADYAKELSAWNAERRDLEAQAAEYVHRRRQEIGELKIMIPDSLRSIYERVSNLGK